MIAASYPVLDSFLTMLYFFLFVIWIWLLITVFIDIFRSHDMGGGVKAVWVIFVIIFPFLGVFIYLSHAAARCTIGPRPRQRSSSSSSTPTLVRPPAPRAATPPAALEARRPEFRRRITDAEFEAQKAKLLAS